MCVLLAHTSSLSNVTISSDLGIQTSDPCRQGPRRGISEGTDRGQPHIRTDEDRSGACIRRYPETDWQTFELRTTGVQGSVRKGQGGYGQRGVSHILSDSRTPRILRTSHERTGGVLSRPSQDHTRTGTDIHTYTVHGIHDDVSRSQGLEGYGQHQSGTLHADETASE